MHCSAVYGSCVQVRVFLFLAKHSEHLSGASSASMPVASGIGAATHTDQNHVPALSCFFIFLPLSHQEQEFAAHFNLEKELANEAGKALMKRFKTGFSNCKSMQNNYFISFHFTSLSIIESLGRIYGLYFTSSKDFQVLFLCVEFNVCHARGRATRSRSNFGVPPPYCLQRLIMQHHKVQGLNTYEHMAHIV